MRGTENGLKLFIELQIDSVSGAPERLSFGKRRGLVSRSLTVAEIRAVKFHVSELKKTIFCLLLANKNCPHQSPST